MPIRQPPEAAGPDTGPHVGLDWGFEQLSFDDAALAAGRLVLRSAAGRFADGARFHHGEPLAVELPPGALEATAWLAPGPPPALRVDAGSGAMPVAQVARASADAPWRPDDHFVPPTRWAHASPLLSRHLSEAIGLIEQKAASLAGRLSNAGQISDVADFLMLLEGNRALAELRHLRGLPDLHPERLFVALARLVAGNATLASPHVAAPLPAYCHHDGGTAFRELMEALRQQLSPVMASPARAMTIEARRYGVHVVTLDGAVAAHPQGLVLAVKAQLPADTLRSRFASQVKLGPVPKIRDLVNLQLPGIALKALPVAPRWLPYDAGSAYFALEDAGSDLFAKALADGHLALHVAGDFPGLEMTLWHLPDGR